MVAIPQIIDPTLEAVKQAYMQSRKDERRDYLGASLIGHPCSRYIWYEINHYPKLVGKAEWLWAAEDGHRVEDVVANRLRLVPGIELWTHKPDGNQYGWQALGGKFRGHLDGVIRGLLQAPKTLHVWENKCSNHKKFSEFQKAKMDWTEKRALEKWNPRYYAQSVVNMHYMNMDRSYTTVCYAGGREIDSCRTEYDPEHAEKMIDKADKILTVKIEPPRISENPDFYQCKMCDRREICFL